MTLGALPCIVCGIALDGTFLGEDVRRNNQPLDGCAFSSPGHYGTAVFDPMNGDRLEINVCDRCLTRAGRAKAVLHHRFAQPKHYRKDTFWNPPASVDTHPKDGNSTEIEVPLVSGAVGSEASETP